ncbi:Ribosomal-protein-S5p-alanine acetyltransferase [Streptococcus mitis]|uniref:Ribosomal-protein-S5p-alanine acetyltransferase n=1 Tax=Streptococcus mitis TaxID=28037 RepID=A0A139PRM3_STRMT|nr:Ribosomal-protein-S5p-alanine acetyltransferase [Streptococcus mitis]
MFSFFETDRLYLRPFFFSDSQDFHQIASNPENLQFIFPNSGKSGRKSICTGQLLYEVSFGSVGNL